MGDPRESGLLDHGPWIQKGLEHRDPSDARVKPLRVDSCVFCHVRGSHFPAGAPREDKCSPGKVRSEKSLMVYCFFPHRSCIIIQTHRCPGFISVARMKYPDRKQLKEKEVYLSLQFQVTVFCIEVKVAGRHNILSYCMHG